MSDGDCYDRLADLAGMHSASEDEAELRAEVAQSPELQQRLRALQRVHRVLSDSEEIEEPSASLQARVLSIPSLASRPLGAPSRRGWAAIGAVAAAAASVAALLVVTSVGGDRGEFESAAEPTALVGDAGEPFEVVVELGKRDGNDQPVRLDASGLRRGGSYALWLVGPRGAVEIDSFAPDPAGECHVTLIAPPNAWKAAVITKAGEAPGPGAIARGRIATS